MILEPLFGRGELARIAAAFPPDERDEALQHERDRRALLVATQYAVVGLRQRGVDLPVGAVALFGDTVVGRYIASDQRLGFTQMHAERMAIAENMLDRQFSLPADEVAVTMEPCEDCQDFLARHTFQNQKIKRVIFALRRNEVAEMGLVRPHEEDIFARAQRIKLPYEVVHVDDERIGSINRIVMGSAHRDVDSGRVIIDRVAFEENLERYLSGILGVASES